MNLFNGQDWESVDYAELTNSSQLANYQAPILLSSPILAIYVATQNPQPTWYSGGWARQYTGTGLIGSSFDWKTYTKKLILGKNIVAFPQDYDTYSLQINFPVYFQNATVAIWQFTGEIDGNESIFGEVGQAISDTAALAQDITAIAQQVANLLTIVNAIRAIVGA